MEIDDSDKFRAYLPNNSDQSDNGCNLCLNHFDMVRESDVSNYIKSIPINESNHNNIPIKIIRQILPSRNKPFTHIINLSLSSGIMPDIVKIAMVSPIFKGGDIKDPSNYRPISILPILLGKTIEFLVNNQLTQYLDDRGIISEHHYGFCKDPSTTYLMLDLFDDIYSSKSKQNCPAVVFLNIIKKPYTLLAIIY